MGAADRLLPDLRRLKHHYRVELKPLSTGCCQHCHLTLDLIGRNLAQNRSRSFQDGVVAVVRCNDCPTPGATND